jgi:arylformamidase
MVCWPKNPSVEIDLHRDMARGDPSTVSRLKLGAHTGTHMDAPAHFIEGGAGIDSMSLDVTVGPARVVAITGLESGSIGPSHLEGLGIERGERVLFRTRNSERVWKTDEFLEEFVYFSPEGAGFLADRGVRCVGIDYLSVGGYGPDKGAVATHRTFLKNGVWIIEGLDLSGVEEGCYDLVCLPLKLVGADGAPARAAIKPRRE